MNKNALVLFCMIDNLDEVTFAFRDSQSDGKLDDSKYYSALFHFRYTLIPFFRRKADSTPYDLLKPYLIN